MPTADVLDFDKLLSPISDEQPAGEDLRGNAGPTSLYYKVKDARSAARAAERQMEGGLADAPTADWKAVTTPAIKALGESSKDLEIAAYLIEGLCRTKGFAGLRDGFKLTRGLVERFWDNLYPTPDEEGIATRVAPLTGLNGDDAEGTLIAPINRIALTDSASFGGLTFSNYMQAAATARILDKDTKEERIAAGAMNTELFQKAVAETSTEFYRDLYEDLNAAIEEFAGMGNALDAAAGSVAPPTSAIRTALENVLDAIKDVARGKLPAAPIDENIEPSEESGETSSGENSDSGEDRGSGERLPTIRNRNDALRAIETLAEYFRRSEPHSMIPYALEQAVRWGRMSLPELFAELIPDDNPREALFKQVGIRADG